MSLSVVVPSLLAAVIAYVIFKRLTTTHPYHDVPIPKRDSWLLGNDVEREEGRQAGAKLMDYAKEFKTDVFVLPEPVG